MTFRIAPRLPRQGGLNVLLSGVGTGLDLPLLLPAHRYVGLELVVDKFLKLGQRVPLRRALSPWTARFATRLDVVFEEVLVGATGLKLVSDDPILARGWVRIIDLLKTS